VAERRLRQAALLAAKLVVRPQRLTAVVVRRLQFALWMRRSRHLSTHDERVGSALRMFATSAAGERQ
jgi:hypothetical protein